MRIVLERIFILMMVTVFTVTILRVSTNNFMSAEEELLENIHKASHREIDPRFSFYDVFRGSQEYRLASSKDCNLTNRNNTKINYENPLIDIPLMPPEL